MKKVLLSTLTLSAGVLLFSNVAFAAPEDPVLPTDPIEKSSDLSIRFENELINDGKGPFARNLSLTFVPTTFAFGTQQANFATSNTYELLSSHAQKQWVVVNDDRREEDVRVGKEWAVDVSMNPITEVLPDGSGETPTVIDGELIMNFESIQEYFMGDAMKGDDIDPAKPTTDGVVKDWVAGNEPTDIKFGANTGTDLAGGTINLTSTGSQPVIKQDGNRERANEGDVLEKRQGYATNLKKAEIMFTSLTSDDLNKDYATTINWTLTRDVPAAP